MSSIIKPDQISRLTAELAALDNEKVQADGVWLLPSQCYHVGDNPSHILFNTNCPDDLKARVQSILSNYTVPDEDRS